jgi:hypothetical protein
MNLNAIRFSTDLQGHIFVKPFNNYCSYYHERFSGATSMQKVAFSVHLLVTSPIGALLGIIALYGMIFKIIDGYTVKGHNEECIALLNSIETSKSIKTNLHHGAGVESSSDWIGHGYELRTFYSVFIDNRLGDQNISSRISEVNQKVKDFTENMRKVYYRYTVVHEEVRSGLSISLRTLEPIS